MVSTGSAIETPRSGISSTPANTSTSNENRQVTPLMALGYDGKLFILAFDHRGSFQKKMFGIQGEPDEEQTRTISDAKHLIYEGLLRATEEGLPASEIGCLVDEQFGGS